MSFEQDHRMPLASEDNLALDEELQYDRPTRSRLPGVLVGLIIAAFLMGGAFWWGYDLGQRGENGLFPPLIQADRAPIKEAPEDPGGRQFPNQESLVFDGVTGDDDAEARVGVLATPPEEPLARSETQRIARQGGEAEALAAAIRVIDTEAGGAQAGDTTANLPPVPPPLAEEDLSAAAPRQTARTVTSEPLGQDQTRGLEQAGAEQQIAAAATPAAPRAGLNEPAETETAAVAAPAPEIPGAAPPAGVASGAFHVQIGSYRTEAGALAGWKILQSAHETLLADLQPTVVSADLGARGVFHRLQAGPLGDRGAANTLCNSLKARKQGCLVVGP